MAETKKPGILSRFKNWLSSKFKKVAETRVVRWVSNKLTGVSNAVNKRPILYSALYFLIFGSIAVVMANVLVGLAVVITYAVGVFTLSSYNLSNGILKLFELVCMIMAGLFMSVVIASLFMETTALDFAILAVAAFGYYAFFKYFQRIRFSNEMAMHMSLTDKKDYGKPLMVPAALRKAAQSVRAETAHVI